MTEPPLGAATPGGAPADGLISTGSPLVVVVCDVGVGIVGIGALARR